MPVTIECSSQSIKDYTNLFQLQHISKMYFTKYSHLIYTMCLLDFQKIAFFVIILLTNHCFTLSISYFHRKRSQEHYDPCINLQNSNPQIQQVVSTAGLRVNLSHELFQFDPWSPSQRKEMYRALSKRSTGELVKSSLGYSRELLYNGLWWFELGINAWMLRVSLASVHLPQSRQQLYLTNTIHCFTPTTTMTTMLDKFTLWPFPRAIEEYSVHMWCITAKGTLSRLPLVSDLQTLEANK